MKTAATWLPRPAVRTAAATGAAMLCFAGNSLLCRAALKHSTIDPSSFTSLRLLAGAATLYGLMRLRQRSWESAGSWGSATALFVYAAAFSLAYVSLGAATGALLLFGAVQVTMIAEGIRRGEQLGAMALLGLLVSLGGLTGLLLPGLTAPPLGGTLLMIAAGIAWGIYSLRGRGAAHPMAVTAGNFARALPFTGLLSMATGSHRSFDATGAGEAIASGALTSAIGYAIWYRALPGLTTSAAATVQLSVPVIAAGGGVLLLGEAPSLRLALAAIAVIGGIALVTLEKR